MNLGDIETAVRLQKDLVIMILNDDAYGMIKWKQKNMGFEDFWLDLKNPNFPLLAQAFGAQWHKLDDPDSFKEEITKIINSPWVHIVEVPFQYPEKIQ